MGPPADAPLEAALAAIPAVAAAVYLPLDGGPGWSARAEEPFPAASLLKVPILLELFRQARAGRLSLEERLPLGPDDRVGGAGVLGELREGLELTLRELARLMIVVSDNVASNLLLDRLGLKALDRALPDLGMTGSAFRRRFMHPPGPEGDNEVTAADMARCLEGLWSGHFLGGESRREALEILGRQQLREKIPLLLPPTARVAHKTGELEGVRHDAALIEDRGRAWALVVLTREGGAPWEVDLGIARLSLACHLRALGEAPAPLPQGA